MPESDGTLQLSMVEIVCRCMSDRFGEEAALARLERIMPSGRSRRHVVLSECPVTGRGDTVSSYTQCVHANCWL